MMNTELLINEKNLSQSRIFIKDNADDDYIVESKRVIDEILSLMTHSIFKILEHIDIDNLRYFWLEVLSEYQDKTITTSDILDIVDSLECYLNKRFEDDYPEFEWLIFPDFDPRSIGLNATQHVKDAVWITNLAPQFIQVIQNYLQTPPSREEEANRFMDELFTKLETKHREKATEKQGETNIITWDELQ